MSLTLASVVAAFGLAAKEKLKSPVIAGQPEDQLRGPFETLLADLADLAGITDVTAIGESSLSDLKTRPDYAVTVGKALVGFVEIKAPGKGGDPRKFKDKHDKAQWEKLSSLPNLIYTDGNAFSLWQDGELVGTVIKLDGDIETSGAALKAPGGLLTLFETFLNWQPIAPASAKALAETTARLCRLLRDEVTEQLERKSEVLNRVARRSHRGHRRNSRPCRQTAFATTSAVMFGNWTLPTAQVRVARPPGESFAPSQIIW